jgi:hypothetical protein
MLPGRVTFERHYTSHISRRCFLEEKFWAFRAFCFEKVICANFTFKTSRKELKEFAFKYGYNNRNAAEINKRLLDKGIFIEIGLDEIYPAKLFMISQSDLEEVSVFAELIMGRNEYLSISNLHGYEEELPELEFPWNAFLLKSVLEIRGYRQVKKIISDYRYDKIIVVRESSEIQSFEDLFLHIIKLNTTVT